jgi:hypothetical protein
MYYRHQTKEQFAAKLAYTTRGKRIQAGAVAGLLEKDNKTIREDVRTLIDEALAKRRQGPAH